MNGKEITLFNDFGLWLKGRFPFKVQKISVDAGFTCPNRDGRVGVGGCSFCNNQTFSPIYLQGRKSITEQLSDGKQFFARKYPEMRYLAYFQSFSNTYAPLSVLRERYEEALAVPDVVGLVVGTRPDCVSADVLDYLADLSRRVFVLVEYGVESVSNDTLRRIGRGHTFECSAEAIRQTHQRGILCGAHTILGLPGERREDFLQQAETMSALPIDVLKVHQLQIVRGTRMAREYAEEPFPLFSMDEYIALVSDYLELLRPDIVVDRFVSQSPSDLLIAPRWGVKNHEFTDQLRLYMQRHDSYQGKQWHPNELP